MSNSERSPRRRFIDQAPIIKLRFSHLQEPVSWSAHDRRAVTLGEWLAVHTPTVAQRFGIKPVEIAQPIPRVAELTDEEARNSTI